MPDNARTGNRDCSVTNPTPYRCATETPIWLGHVMKMDNCSPEQLVRQHSGNLRLPRKPGRPRKNWVDVIKRDLRQMDLTREEAEELANDKAEWRRRHSDQCSHLSV